MSLQKSGLNKFDEPEVKTFKNLKTFIIGIALLVSYHTILAQSKVKSTDEDAQGEISTVLTTHSSDGIFNSTASFTFEVKNTYRKIEWGKVSYLVTDQRNKKILSDSVPVKISSRGSDSYHFSVPNLASGFYKINFMINVTDYDDTTKRDFGIRPSEITSSHPKPVDFDSFWQTAKDELAKVKPDYKITEKPELEKLNRKVYQVEMKSLGNITIRGWLTEPVTKSKYKKFPVLLGLPGYQVTLAPIMGEDDDLAIFTIDVRGQGLSKDVIDTRRDDFIVYNLEDKNKYVMRGVIMDCIRSIDFIYSRPELRHDNILVSGGSMGGFLTIATAGLDKR
ncbi:MAG TPA: acetylxylan esterase, partial [Mucilaginibacter sp.]